jgi:hypothetical protein
MGEISPEMLLDVFHDWNTYCKSVTANDRNWFEWTIKWWYLFCMIPLSGKDALPGGTPRAKCLLFQGSHALRFSFSLSPWTRIRLITRPLGETVDISLTQHWSQLFSRSSLSDKWSSFNIVRFRGKVQGFYGGSSIRNEACHTLISFVGASLMLKPLTSLKR